MYKNLSRNVGGTILRYKVLVILIVIVFGLATVTMAQKNEKLTKNEELSKNEETQIIDSSATVIDVDQDYETPDMEVPDILHDDPNESSEEPEAKFQGLTQNILAPKNNSTVESGPNFLKWTIEDSEELPLEFSIRIDDYTLGKNVYDISLNKSKSYPQAAYENGVFSWKLPPLQAGHHYGLSLGSYHISFGDTTSPYAPANQTIGFNVIGTEENSLPSTEPKTDPSTEPEPVLSTEPLGISVSTSVSDLNSSGQLTWVALRIFATSYGKPLPNAEVLLKVHWQNYEYDHDLSLTTELDGGTTVFFGIGKGDEIRYPAEADVTVKADEKIANTKIYFNPFDKSN